MVLVALLWLFLRAPVQANPAGPFILGPVQVWPPSATISVATERGLVDLGPAREAHPLSRIPGLVQATIRADGFEPWSTVLHPRQGERLPERLYLLPVGFSAVLKSAPIGVAAWMLAVAFLFYRSQRAVRDTRRAQRRATRLEGLLSSQPSDGLVGSRVGNYRILDVLGQGGMAIVYRGVADATFPEGEEVAIKLIHARLDKDSDYHLRFKEEINITSRLNHPSIVRVLDYGEHKGMPYLVMELVSGTPLNRAIQGPMAIDRFQALFGSLVDAIDYAHRQGVVHRDLKPPNIMLTQSDRVFIMDFGVAFTGDRRLVRTQTGAMLGTPAYMAPEQFDNEPATAMADQYSLGMTGFWMLTGRLPVTEDNQYAMIVEKLMSELPGPRNFRPDVPPAIDGMIVRMMSRKPEARFDSMAAVAAALRTMVLAALLLLGWGGMATAQTGTMGPLDDVWPPGAVVYLESATGPVALGPANAALPIPAGPAALQIEIQADGYAPYLATIVPGDKAAASLPRPLRLVPIAFSSAMATLWHLFPIPCCALVATPVLLLSLYLAARLWLRTLAARIDRLEGRRPAAARTGSAPSRLAGYEIIRVLGEGGMAVVYEGRREGAAKAPRVAIKVIRPAHEDATEYVLRFRREVSILARLTHPGIVSVIDFGEHHGLPYLVMELIEGESVGRVATRQPVDLPMALDICRGVLDAVGYAHSQGILHRDLKPNNVMIRKNGQPVVLDFGIANVDSGKQLLTQTGALLGTPAYMAPEQLLNQPATAASDQYSLGITFFELFTGELPVRGDHTVAVIAEKLQNRVTRMSDIRSDIPPQLEEVIARMLAHQPGHRYPELRAVAAALHAIRL